MGLTPLTETQEIEAAFNSWAKRMHQDSQPYPNHLVGWSGGHGRFTVYWHPTEQIWSLMERYYAKNRYWCCFGTRHPSSPGNLSITCEINIPYQGINRRVAGVFAQARDGHFYLTHSGKVAGGRSGIGKEAFVTFYGNSDNWDTVYWPDGKETETILIGRLNGRHLLSHIAHFVRKVESFKKYATSGQTNPLESPTFNPEFSGTRQSYRVKGKVESRCDHGLVISALEAELWRQGLTVGNDQARDLFVIEDGQTTTLFEAKTDTSTSSIYSAIGQLMFHSTTQRTEPKRVMVLPERPNEQTQNALTRLGIAVLAYHWHQGRPIFENIEVIIQPTDVTR